MNLDKLIVSAYVRAFLRSDALYRNLGIVKNKQGIARAFLKSDALQRGSIVLVQENRICLKNNNKNVIGIIVDKDLKDKVVNVNRIGDMLLLIKLVFEEETINVISTYTPQVGLDDRIKRQFWEDIDGIIRETIIGFIVVYDLAIANTCFKKRDKYLITYNSGTHKSHMDLSLVKKVDRSLCKNCKIIPRESLSTQHSLVVVEFKK
ncbi:hypothetical protein AMTRI_Chr11g93670 [Amborella trichopoda]